MENLQVMVVLFTIVIIGYVLNKKKMMGGDFDKKLSAIVVNVTCPLLILSSVTGDTLPDRNLILPLMGVGILTYILLTAVAFTVPKIITRDREKQGMVGFALMFANVGFIGYPVVASIFGDTAVFYAALLNMANTFFIFTVGVTLIKGEGSLHKFNPKGLLSPPMIAAYLSIVIVAFGWHVPAIVAKPVTMVGNITVPASLMIIGSSMGQLPLRQMLGGRDALITSFLRLTVVPVSVYFLFRLLGVNELVNGINMVVIAMPVASFGTMFCLKYDRDVRMMTSMTFVTTLASVITIPLIAYFL